MVFWSLRHGLIAGAAAVLAAIVGCAAPKPTDAPENDPMVGQLLVASPTMEESLFHHTVILILQHNEHGAFGIIVNRPIGEVSLVKLEQLIGEKDKKAEGSVLLFYGGPINRAFVLVVHSTDYRQPETIGLDEHVAVTSSPEVIVDMGQARGPKKSLVAFGYTGWGAGQLEIELARHDWFLASGEPALIFDDDRRRVWEHAIARSETDL